MLWLYVVAASVCAVGVLLAVVALVAIWRRYKADRVLQDSSAGSGESVAEPPTPHAPVRSAELAEAQRLFSLMGDAEELVGRLSVQLNESAARLERLIAAADDRLARLERAAAAPAASFAPPPPVQAPFQNAPIAAPVPPARPAPDPAARRPFPTPTPSPAKPPVPPAPAAPYVPQSPATPAPPPAPTIVTRPQRSPAPAGVSSPSARPPENDRTARRESVAPQGLDPLTNEIYRLADDGLGVVEIAKQLGQHTGKVELILALRQG